jgi:hypothetical protein
VDISPRGSSLPTRSSAFEFCLQSDTCYVITHCYKESIDRLRFRYRSTRLFNQTSFWWHELPTNSTVYAVQCVRNLWLFARNPLFPSSRRHKPETSRHHVPPRLWWTSTWSYRMSGYHSQCSGWAYRLDDLVFESRVGPEIILSSKSSRPPPGPNDLPIQWVPGVKKPGREVDHFLQVPELKMTTATPLLPLYVFVAWTGKNSWPLKMGTIGRPETSVQNYNSALPNIPEERKLYLVFLTNSPTSFR